MSFHERYSRFYRDAVSARGLTYHYLSIPPSDSSLKPTLVFLHGFPSTSYDWHHQIEYFKDKGYGLIVFDMLGYGGSDKPVDSASFRLKALAQDIVDVVATELNPTGPGRRAIAIGHDWGSIVLSRIAVYHPDVFEGYAWLAVSFVHALPPSVDFDTLLPMLKAAFGAELFAYQEFLVKPDTAKWLENNFDSYVDISFPADPAQWSVLTARGEFEEWIKTNKRGKRAQWMTDEHIGIVRKSVLNGGLNSALSYYRSLHEGINTDDESKLQGSNMKIDKPVFFGAAMYDSICIPSVHIPAIQSVASNLTLVEFDTGHWVNLEQPDKLNEQLGRWLETTIG